jgi:RimJ/RimL family protein N-acetyltransferase
MSYEQNIRLEKFSEKDFDRLISWINDEKELIQFAGPIFTFPLTHEQLHNYLADIKRHAFKIIHNETNNTIGHCETYQTNEQNSRLCRILIGDKSFRGKGFGTILTKLLTEWSFENLKINSVDLNVYEFNTFAIKAYEKVGFKKTIMSEGITRVNNESWKSHQMSVTREEFSEKTSRKTDSDKK